MTTARTRLRPASRRLASGFTLIELMIVVAIIAILAAIAYPSYAEAVRKGRRAEARTALLQLMQQQERFMTQNNTYQAFANVAGTTTPATVPFIIQVGSNASAPSYWLSAVQCPAVGGGTQPAINACIQGVASPTRPDAAVGNLTLTSTGVKGCSGTTTDSRLCWP